MEFKISKKRIIICSILCIVLISLLVGFRNDIFILGNRFCTLPFISSIFSIIIFSALIAFPFTIKEKYQKYFTIFNVLFSIIFMTFIIELFNENNMFTIEFRRLSFNFILIALIYLFFICVINKLKLSLIISNTLLFGLGFANYSVTSLRETPLSLLDILSIGTGLTIADTYTLIINFYLVLAFICFGILVAVNLRLDYKFTKTKKNIMHRILLLLSVLIIIALIFVTDLINIFNLDTNLWVPCEEYHYNGFLASFVKQIKDLIIKKPNSYSISAVEDLYYNTLEEITTSNNLENSEIETPKENTNKPNIIVIMSESFADMQVHHSFDTNVDYMPYFKYICQNTISGNVHSSVYGGKTPNSEWEFLTNNSMAFFSYGSIPYQQFVRKNSYSLATTLKAQGYETIALHTWHKTGYRRSSVYPLLGFDLFVSLEDVNDKLDYIRNYPSDLSTYKEIVKLFENRDNSKPFFNFTVTMQNHSGYDYEGEDFTSTVKLKDIPNCPRVEQYLSLVKESDEALKYLINYFKNIDENTIIVFFGDHQPPYIEEEFWEYINQDKTDGNLADEEKSYITPYFIWANYDLPEAEVPDISLNYLSVLLLDIANLKTNSYQDFLRSMQKDIPVITGHGYMDNSGNYHNFDEVNEYSQEIKDYKILQYNNMFDRKNTFNKMFEISK